MTQTVDATGVDGWSGEVMSLNRRNSASPGGRPCSTRSPTPGPAPLHGSPTLGPGVHPDGGAPEPQVAWAQPGADIRRRPEPGGAHLNGCLRTILGEEGKTLTGRDVTPGNTWWTFTNFPDRDDLRLLDMLSVVHDVPPVIQPQHHDLYGTDPAGTIATGLSGDT